MKINSSYIGMESARTYSSVKASTMRLSYGRLTSQPGFTGQFLNTDVKDNRESGESGNTQGSARDSRIGSSYLQDRLRSVPNIRQTRDRDLSSALDQIREQCLRYIFDLLFGGKRIGRSGEENSFQDWMQTGTGETGQIQEEGSGSFFVETIGFTQEYLYTEQETTDFSTEGMVRTADGREIRFNLDVSMSRRFTQYYREEFQMQTLQTCDPLVINLDSDVAELSDQKFFFDLDADGELDEISMLGSGSGYLALDKNQDGVINDGSELFGTRSGDGFADLAKYDSDGNGWIDENDPIWDQLKIWCKDADGNDVLYKLADKGVGAICLQRVQTEHSLNSKQDNSTNGYLRSTGIFLYENGMAGTVQHVDLVKGYQQVG